MRLISLNTWGGRTLEQLLKFFDKNQDVDIFCLQEIYNGVEMDKIDEGFKNDDFNLYSDIKNVLPNHVGYFRPHLGNWFGIAIFVKQDIQITKEGEITIYDVEHITGEHYPRNLQYIEFEKDGEKITAVHIHGIWTGKGKGDTPDRLEQSKKITVFLDSIQGKKILCGDFNLLPNTESIKILGQSLRNLVKDYKIESTRTNLYTKPDKFADYIFVSSDLEVKHFEVMPDVVSDHSPLLLEF